MFGNIAASSVLILRICMLRIRYGVPPAVSTQFIILCFWEKSYYLFSENT
ncbi:hypothetical protein HMPREF1147_1427 [Selenomonas sp. FOBRC9]|nr:hypothetical protein HMPREF1147_1427 [Selenomonas sp. FOBRC9]